jgi:hypothetical protein
MTVTAGQPAQVKQPGARTREVKLDPGASADTPVRNQGPGRSLPGPDAGHPLQAAGPITTDSLRRVDSSSDRRQRIMLARSAPTWVMPGLKTDRRRVSTSATAGWGRRGSDSGARRNGVRFACDSEWPTTVTHGQSWSLDGDRHENSQSAFTLVRALGTSPKLVVRGGVEPPTLRFSGRRTFAR